MYKDTNSKDKEKVISACIKLEFGDDKGHYMGSRLIKTLAHKMPLGLGTVYLYEAVPCFMAECRFNGSLEILEIGGNIASRSWQWMGGWVGVELGTVLELQAHPLRQSFVHDLLSLLDENFKVDENSKGQDGMPAISQILTLHAPSPLRDAPN